MNEKEPGTTFNSNTKHPKVKRDTTLPNYYKGESCQYRLRAAENGYEIDMKYVGADSKTIVFTQKADEFIGQKIQEANIAGFWMSSLARRQQELEASPESLREIKAQRQKADNAKDVLCWAAAVLSKQKHLGDNCTKTISQ